MTPILTYSIRIFELIITLLIYITCEYFMGLNILYTGLKNLDKNIGSLVSQ